MNSRVRGAVGILLVFLLSSTPANAHTGDAFRQLHGEDARLQESSGEPPALGWWYGFRNGFQNRGVSPVEVRKFFGQRRGRQPRTFQTHGLIWGTAVIDPEGNVYVGSADKVFYALAPDGSLRWSFTLPDSGDSLIDSAATLAPGGLVVVPGGDGRLHALRRDTGELVWQFEAYHAGDHESGVVVNSFEGNVTLGPDGNLYAGSDNGHLYSLDLSGKERWNFGTGMMIWSAPAFSPDGKWLAFGSLDRNVYVLETATGAKRAAFKGGAEFKASPAIDDEGRIYVGCSDFSFRCLELGKGMLGRPALKQAWSFATRGEIYSSPALADGKVVFGSHDGFVYCLTTDGALVWKYGVHARISSSPLVSRDGVVLVGAKNGKLYALDLETGERIWSFKTTPGLRKVNLDASPALAPDGRVHVGSYDGNVYSVPVEFAVQNPGDARCDTAPGHDVPDFGPGVPASGGTLRFLGRDGRFHASVPGELGAESPLTFKLVAHDDGTFIPNAAIAVTGLKVRVEPPVPIETVISSDSYYLNVFPRTFWQPGTTYKLTITGRYFHRKNPFVDLLKWWFLPKFASVTEFTVGGQGSQLPEAEAGSVLRYGIHGMYVSQPEILDTLVPAAVDGQAFIASAALVDAERGKLGMVVLPAYPRPEGVVLRPAPEKVFVVNGDFLGDSIRAEGRFRMAAMGGDIPFAPIRFFGRLTPGSLDDGNIHGTAPILGIKGNGSTYMGLSWSAIDDMADSRLRLQAIGSVKGDRLPALEVPVHEAGRTWDGEGVLSLTFHETQPFEGSHLITLAVVDRAAGQIRAAASAVLEPGEGDLSVKLAGLDRKLVETAGIETRLLFDGEPVPAAHR